MILVTGDVHVREEHLARALELSLEHVTRSRTEPGCLLHSVHRDVENPLHLVFVEHWVDRAALDAHFAVPASRALVKALAGLSSQPPKIQIFEAQRLG